MVPWDRLCGNRRLTGYSPPWPGGIGVTTKGHYRLDASGIIYDGRDHIHTLVIGERVTGSPASE